ncbi:AraC family transcriptional regulator [Nocardia panacis]|uniref:AraC family transcriptional regulator n=1 Tax=Nocardia panacis TaxID=2340916 RepID=A0A3A4KMN5_9NOCA|nr:AraC family transcriptional regulator [Nocardia panacis]RJO78397.1 AraC family transcriptional regulator [Nocardia panacis]
MFDWDFRRGTAGVHVLMQLAEERGLDPDRCFAGTTLTPEAVLAPDAEVTARQELRVVRNLLAHCGDEPGLGLEAGARHHISLYGPWGLALVGSRTVREVVEVALRCLELAFVFGGLVFEEDTQEGRLVVESAELPARLRTFLTERAMAGLQTIVVDLFETALPIRRVLLRDQAPAEIIRYRDTFGVTPIFDATADLIVIDGRGLDLSLPRAGDWARGSCEQLCRDLLDQRAPRAGVAAEVRDVLVRDPGRLPDQSAVAGGLFMSPRTLSRRLNEERTSFRALLDEVRQMMAEELLTHTDLTTEQLAARLGYAEAASFIRAFRRWKGCPPQEFRAHRTSVTKRRISVASTWSPSAAQTSALKISTSMSPR